MRSIFVTGTDTNVGKTVATAGIAAAMARAMTDVGVMKPVATGARRKGGTLVSPDAQFLMASAGVRDPMDLVNPVCLEPALAPNLAARISHRPIELARVWKAYKALRSRHDAMVVEGIGGLMVPILDRYFVADMVRRLRLPIVIVTRPRLGTLNHTLLTVMAARHYGLEVLGLIVNHAEKIRPGAAERLSRKSLEAVCGVPVLGEVGHVDGLSPRSLPREPFDEIVKVLG